jgi:hypothetical protein
MHRFRQISSAAFALVVLVTMSVQGIAQRQPYRLRDRQVEQILIRLETNADRYRGTINEALDRSSLNNTRFEGDIVEFIRDFESATDRLRNNFNARNSTTRDVQEVFDRAILIDDFMRQHGSNLNVQAQRDWDAVRVELNALSGAYNVPYRRGGGGRGMTGGGMTGGGVSQRQPYRLRDRQLEQVLMRLETNADRFRGTINEALDRSTLNDTRFEHDMVEFIRDFESATDRLRNNFNARNSTAQDVQEVFDRAILIDDFMSRYGRDLNVQAQRDWDAVRVELNALSGAYSVPYRRSSNVVGGGGGINTGGGFSSDARLTGTYSIDRRASDEPRNVADRATRDLPAGERSRVYDVVVARLESPDVIAIERRGRNVTVISSRGARTTFEADGTERTEELSNGRVARVRAFFEGDTLVIRQEGFRENDYEARFEPVDNGNRLLVTRSIYSERLVPPVTSRTYYTRTSASARYDIYNETGTMRPGDNRPTTTGAFLVRDGETLVAVLDNDLSTERSTEGERFTMTVRSPSAYEGAVIEGRVSRVDRGGRVSGRADMTLNFDRITYRGREYQFAGFIEAVRTANGDNVRVDNEGGVAGSSQTRRTAQRAAIGAAVGAIIGAIAGGGSGAAIGAGVGAGAGAGSVYVQGRNDLELLRGTELTLRASAPR